MTHKFGLSGVTGRGVRTVALGAAALAMTAGGTAVAVGQITSAGIKDGTIQTRDLTKNNFARFTSTESVVSGITPVSTVPAYDGQRVVPVAAGTTSTPLVTIVLDKGTWKITGTAQFWHKGPGNPSGSDDGLAIVGVDNGFQTNYTDDVPDSGATAAQVSFNGTITITANDTPVTVGGQFTGGNAGQAGASITATQYVYVKQFNHGQ